MILELEHIYKDYISEEMTVPVLKDINLKVNAGEYLAVMGPSGSGKTTLMNLLGCLARPTKGTYFLEEKDVSGYDDGELSDVRLNSVGFVFQNFHLLPKLTALDNVALPLSYAGVPLKERKAIARKALTKVGLEDRLDFMPNQLSGGQKQRVAIARAMVNNPKILLADEPTGALDSKSGISVMELFRKLNEEGMTVIMITHNEKVAGYAKRVIHLFDGEIIREEVQEESAPGEGQKEITWEEVQEDMPV